MLNTNTITENLGTQITTAATKRHLAVSVGIVCDEPNTARLTAFITAPTPVGSFKAGSITFTVSKSSLGGFESSVQFCNQFKELTSLTLNAYAQVSANLFNFFIDCDNEAFKNNVLTLLNQYIDIKSHEDLQAVNSKMEELATKYHNIQDDESGRALSTLIDNAKKAPKCKFEFNVLNIQSDGQVKPTFVTITYGSKLRYTMKGVFGAMDISRAELQRLLSNNWVKKEHISA